MDEANPVPGPAHDQPHPPSARRVKRRLIGGLVALHVLSLAAASFLILRGGSQSPKETDAKGKPLLALQALEPKATVGWVSIRGTIMSSESGRPWEHGAEQWAKRIEQLAESKDVKAIVLDINSPGGSVGAVQEVYSRILRVKKKTHIPFIALFGDVAASGGYYIASACDQIVAHPGTLTGSIGVIFSVTNMEGLFTKIGLKMDPIKSGKHKDIGSPARPMTKEERQILQDVIDDAYGQFVQAVADGRKLGVDQVKILADGRIYSGRQALDNKLVDQLGDSQDAIKLAAKLGGINDEKPRIHGDGEHLNDFIEMLQSKVHLALNAGNSSLLPLGALAQEPKGLLYMWNGQ